MKQTETRTVRDDLADSAGVPPPPGARRPPGAPSWWLAHAVRLSIVAPVLTTCAYLVLVFGYLRRMLVGVFLNSDVASIPLLAGDVLHRAGGIARISLATYYSSFLFDFITRPLPFHRVWWEGLSLGASWAGTALIAWAVGRTRGRPAGVLTLVIGLAVSPTLLYNLVALRGPTWFADGLMLAALVLLAFPPAPLADPARRWRLVSVVAAVGVVAGVSIASDPLFVVGGLLPFLGAGVGAWLLWRTPAAARVARGAAAVAVLAGASAGLTYMVMPHFGFRIVPTTPTGVAPLSRIHSNLIFLVHDLLAFGNAFPRPPSVWTSPAGVVTVLLCLGAAAAVIRNLLRLRALARSGSDAKAVALTCVLAFLVLTVVVDGGAFVFSTLPIADVGTARYVMPIYFAIAAGMGLWGAEVGWPRLAAACVATALCVLSIQGLGPVVRSYQYATVAADGPKVLSFLNAEGLTKGYASYWDALALTWVNDSRVGVYPVKECASPPDRQLCEFGVNTLTSWFNPAPGRSFVLVGPVLIPIMAPFVLQSPPPPVLGTPLQVQKLGAYTVFVYDHDISPQVGPPGPGD